MRQGGSSAWGIQTGSLFSPFCSEIFTTFPLSYWRAHFYYPRGLMMGKGNSPNSKTDETGRSKYLFHFHLKEPFYTTDKGVFCTERLLTAPRSIMVRLEGEVVGPCRSREVPPQAVRGQAVAAFIVVKARRIEAVLKSLQLH